MTEFDKSQHPSDTKQPNPEMVGKFVESDKKKLETAVVEKLKSLGSKLTRKDIQELLSHVETAKNIEALKEKLNAKTAERADDLALEEIFALYNEIRRGAQEGIKELKINLNDLLKSNEVQLRKGVFLSERFEFTKKLEKSELGNDVILDLAGALVGTVDSIVILLRLLLDFAVDAVKLPHQVYLMHKERRSTQSTDQAKPE